MHINIFHDTTKTCKRILRQYTYPEYTEEDKKRGMNNKDLDFMTDGNNGMYYAVFLPSLMAIGMGILPFIVMFVFFEKPDFLKP